MYPSDELYQLFQSGETHFAEQSIRDITNLPKETCQYLVKALADLSLAELDKIWFTAKLKVIIEGKGETYTFYTPLCLIKLNNRHNEENYFNTLLGQIKVREPYEHTFEHKLYLEDQC